MCTPSKLGGGIELKGPGRYKKVMISQDVSIFFFFRYKTGIYQKSQIAQRLRSKRPAPDNTSIT
jgi:hypothetical protein